MGLLENGNTTAAPEIVETPPVIAGPPVSDHDLADLAVVVAKLIERVGAQHAPEFSEFIASLRK